MHRPHGENFAALVDDLAGMRAKRRPKNPAKLQKALADTVQRYSGPRHTNGTKEKGQLQKPAYLFDSYWCPRPESNQVLMLTRQLHDLHATGASSGWIIA